MFPTLFSLEIPFLDITLEPRFYGLFYAIAILIGSRIVLSEVNRRQLGLSEDEAMNLTLYAFLVGLLGARTYEIVMEWSNYYAHQPFWKVFAVWQGGLAIHGGILGGSLFTIFYCHQKQISLGHVLDIAALCMIQGQAIGRWGNFTNGEAAGPVTKFWTGITFPPGTVIDHYAQGQPVHPTMIYESLGNVLIFLILWRLRLKHFRPGMLGALYLLGYSILRSALTPFRMDNQYLILGDTLILAPYAIGIVLTLVAVVWITRARLWKSDSLLAKNSPSARLSQKRR